MKEIILLICLIIQGVIDWKYKRIPICLSVLGGCIGVAFCVLQERPMVNIVVACMPGVLMLCFSKITKEVLGYGDGIVFIMMGLYLSIEKIIAIGLLAFFIAGITALILLVFFHKKGSYQIAFLPFLSVAYIMDFLWK